MRVAVLDGEAVNALDSGRPSEESNCVVGMVRAVGAVVDVCRSRLSVSLVRWRCSVEPKLSRFVADALSGGMAASVSAVTVRKAFARDSGE